MMYKNVMITGRQIRAARGLLGWKQQDLSKKAEISIASVRRIESSAGVPSVNARKLEQMVSALRDAGISFSYEAGRIALEYDLSAEVEVKS